MSGFKGIDSAFTEATVKGGAAPFTGTNGLGSETPIFRKARPEVSLDDLLADIQQTADLPLNQSRTLPAEVYTSDTFFDWEARNVLRAGWLGLAHVSQIPKPGDFLNLDLLGEPLIVVHGKDGEFRVLSRVCPHRAMDIMPPGFGYDGHGPADAKEGKPGCGHTRLFLCPYHHWSFELDGKLKACPEMHLADGFRRDDVGLSTFRCEVWHGFIFVNLDGKAGSVAEQFTELDRDIAGWNCADMKVVIEKEWDCPFNWKVLVENFMECYHHLGAHCKTLQPLMPAKNTWTEAERAHSIRVNIPLKDDVLEDMAAAYAQGTSVDFPPIRTLSARHQKQWAVFLGQPTLLLFAGPSSMFWYRIDPIGPDRSKLLTVCLANEEALADPEFDRKRHAQVKMLVDFHMEDMEVCTAVQRGYYATGYQRGRLSHLEMPIWLIQRYLAARARGTYPGIDRPFAPSQR
ncbi:MAG TPA: aromatic ring-hydroxylating dioxygenase subunit alpha [Chthoniobacterales bacterium]